MAKVRGLEHFTAYFAGLEDYYVIIGGSAASVLMEENALPFRATQDIDLVILTNPEKIIAEKLLEYLNVGEYKFLESTEDKPKYYRFREPKSEAFPKMIEIFSRNSDELNLEMGQHIIPIETEGSNRLSAILLDEEYFAIIKNNLMKSETGFPVINQIANTCLKARAFCDLSDRKGDSADIKESRVLFTVLTKSSLAIDKSP